MGGKLLDSERREVHCDKMLIVIRFAPNTTQQKKQLTSGDRSGAIQVFERIFFRIFGEIHGNRRKEHDITGKT